MSAPTKLRDDNDSECPCGRAGCKGTRAVNIVIEKQHLRRAIAAADGVQDGATSATGPTGKEGPESGVLFMTAVLLVERLAASFQCAPHVILAKMAECFELKRQYIAERSEHN